MPTEQRKENVRSSSRPRWDHSHMLPDEPAVQNLTLAMAGLTALLVELALAQPGPLRPAGCFAVAGLIATMLLAHRALRRPSKLRMAGASVLIVGLLVGDPLRLLMSAERLPPELILIGSARDLTLALAALASRPVLLRCAGGISAALVLVAACLIESAIGLALLALFTVIGSTWLCLLYWGQVRRDLLPGKSRRLPAATALAAWSLALVALALMAVGPRRAMAVLYELVPTSGGTQRYDPSSRGGVNDGDASTAATSTAQATGMVDSEIFLESNERTLYDVADNRYGKPKKNREHQRAMALTGVQMQHARRPVRNQQVSNSFGMNRQRPSNPGRPRLQRSDAKLFVAGPAPAHLRLTAFDTIALGPPSEEVVGSARLPLDLQPTWGGWLMLPPVKVNYLGGAVRHSIKLAKVEAAQLLTPPQLTGFKLERVKDPSFFAWAQEGILRLADGQVPAGSILDVESRPPDPVRLRSLEFSERPLVLPRYLDCQGIDPRVGRLASQWVAEEPRGWRQVEAVVQRLRADYRHDDSAVAPEECDDPLTHFLLESKEGPDYLFASAAMVMLRSLGYPTRVVWGFYVDPMKYDAQTGHVNVFQQDLHFWTEVFVPRDEWVVIEPTPGYAVASPATQWHERLAATALALVCWVRDRWLPLTFAAALLGLLGWRRHDILDWLATTRWRGRFQRGTRSVVLETLQLLERRAHWAGNPRPRGLTSRAWYKSLQTCGVFDNAVPINEFLEAADWAVYAPEREDVPPPMAAESLCEYCRVAESQCSLRRLREGKTCRGR